MIAEIFDKFREALKAELATLRDVQKSFTAKPEIFGPKLEDAQQRLKFAVSDYEIIFQNVFLKDDIVQKLTELHSAGFEGFVEHTDDAVLARSVITTKLTAPFRKLLDSIPTICSLQTAMLNQAQMKKIPLRYDDIKTGLTKSKQLLADINALLEQMTVFALGAAKTGAPV